MTNIHIIDRIKALRARAGDSASSPAEVQAAAQRAAKLIAEHDLSEADLADRYTNPITQGGTNSRRRTQPPELQLALHGISTLAEVQGLWIGGTATFIGLEQDVVFATYLAELTTGSAKRAWDEYLTTFPRRASPKAMRSFKYAFGNAVGTACHRLAAERRIRRAATNGARTDIAVLKDQLIAEVFNRDFPEIGKARNIRTSALDMTAAVHGDYQGKRVDISRPLQDQTEKRKAI